MANMGQTTLQISDLRFGYDARPVVDLPALSVSAGRSCALIGPSGCGKSTLLHLVAGLLRPQAGRVVVAGQDLTALGDAELDRFRGRHLGIVLQRLHLLSALSVIDNLLLAQRLARVPCDASAVRRSLAELGVEDLAASRPARLSRGQAQRVAIARALVHAPALLLADEPTSSLDDANAARVLELLVQRTRAHGTALLLVTHDRRVSGLLDDQVDLDGLR